MSRLRSDPSGRDRANRPNEGARSGGLVSGRVARTKLRPPQPASLGGAVAQQRAALLFFKPKERFAAKGVASGCQPQTRFVFAMRRSFASGGLSTR